jgi:hypothetical protein
MVRDLSEDEHQPGLHESFDTLSEPILMIICFIIALVFLAIGEEKADVSFSRSGFPCFSLGFGIKRGLGV